MANSGKKKRALIEGRPAHDASLRAMEYLQTGAICSLDDAKAAMREHVDL